MANIQKFGEYTIDAAEQEKAAIDAESGDFMKLAVGRNVVRILPPLRGRDSPFLVAYQHYVDTPEGKWVFNCPRMLAKQRCPLCEHAQRMKKSVNPADRDAAYDLLPKRRVFCLVINRAEPEKGPVVLAFGKTIHEALVKLRQDEDAGGDFSHPVQGMDVIIDREGTGKNDTKYDVNLARRSTPIHPDAATVSAWADMMPDLGDFARLPGQEELMERMAKVFGPDAIPTTGKATSSRGGQKDQQQRRPRAPQQPRPRTAQDDVGDTTDAEYDDADEDTNEEWGIGSGG